jgi:hypothetical protein
MNEVMNQVTIFKGLLTFKYLQIIAKRIIGSIKIPYQNPFPIKSIVSSDID